MSDAGVPPARMRAGVLGSPIAHSLSPAMHRAAYAATGLDWTYDAYDVDEAALPAFIAGLDESWAGLSLTMPLKEAVIGLLAAVDARADLVRAVNTVLPGHTADGDRAGAWAGQWVGVNTDIFGIVQALTERGVGTQGTSAVDPMSGGLGQQGGSAVSSATILGAGATARSAAAALIELGATQIAVCARRVEAAAALAEVVRDLAVLSGAPVAVRTYGIEPDAARVDVDVLVSTLPGDAGAPWAAVAPRARGHLLDASYHPWPTPLASAWPDASRVASGRDMLLWQAVRQFELMTGLDAPVEAMRAALPATP